MDLDAVFPVESVFYEFSLGINFVQDNVGVRLVAGCKCDDFVGFCHSFEKTDGVGSDGDVGLSS